MTLLYHQINCRRWNAIPSLLSALPRHHAVAELFGNINDAGRNAFYAAVANGCPPALLQHMIDLSRFDLKQRSICAIPERSCNWLPLHAAAAWSDKAKIATILVREFPLALLHKSASGHTPLALCEKYNEHREGKEIAKFLQESSRAVVTRDFTSLASLVGAEDRVLERNCGKFRSVPSSLFNI
jgi:hypothetical protein